MNALLISFNKTVEIHGLEYVEQFDHYLLNNLLYINTSGIEFYGFYDWLRNDSGTIIGIRFDAYDVIDYVESTIGVYENVFISEERTFFELYFSKARHFINELSIDQEFGKSAILETGKIDMKYILLVESRNLSKIEFALHIS